MWQARLGCTQVKRNFIAPAVHCPHGMLEAGLHATHSAAHKLLSLSLINHPANQNVSQAYIYLAVPITVHTSIALICC
jgi:hypothetical protein